MFRVTSRTMVTGSFSLYAMIDNSDYRKSLPGMNFVSPDQVLPGPVFCHVDVAVYAMNLLSGLPGPFTLVTTEGDLPADSERASFLPPNITRWFSTNSNPLDRVEGIPLGLPGVRGEIKGVVEEIAGLHEVYKNLVYACFCTNTSPVRDVAARAVRGKSWATLETYHTVGTYPHPYREYLALIKAHPFTLCPSGNGADTHRLWESLYLGCIPICKMIPQYIWFRELPICWIDDWEEIREPFLEKEYERIKGKAWNLEKLSLEYWLGKINNA